MESKDIDKLIMSGNHVDYIQLYSHQPSAVSDMDAEKIVDLIFERIAEKKYKIYKNNDKEEYIKVYIHHADIATRLGTQFYRSSRVISAFSRRSDTKQLKIVNSVGKTYKLHGTTLIEGTQLAKYLGLIIPFVLPGFMYIAKVTQGDMFFILNK